MKQTKQKIILTGERLTIADLVKVAVDGTPVELTASEEVRKRIASSRLHLEQALQQGQVIYGVTTGYGGNVKYLIPEGETKRLQLNLIRSLTCGTGPHLDLQAVRGAMLLRANSLCKGFSAVRQVIVDRLIDFLNTGITPLVPRYGSVGASGDLIPSAYIVRALLGEGEVLYQGTRMASSQAFEKASIEPITLLPKEGLALVNGTTVMTSIAASNLYRARYLARLTVVAVALCVETLKRVADPFLDVIHTIKNHPGQIAVAHLLRRLLEGSNCTQTLEKIRARVAVPKSDQVLEAKDLIQDPYSLRCAPQGLGPVFDGLEGAREVIEREMNSVNDNPLVDPDSPRFYHTGNFYGGHVARAMDGLKIDLANLANWSGALMAMLVDPRFSTGLPANLIASPGLNNGFKGAQLSQSSLICACRQISGPSLIHSLPTEQYNQDMVSLGLHSATTAMDMIPLLRDALAILLLALCQAVDLRRHQAPDLQLGKTAVIYERIRKDVAFLESDRPLDTDVRSVGQMIDQQTFEFPA